MTPNPGFSRGIWSLRGPRLRPRGLLDRAGACDRADRAAAAGAVRGPAGPPARHDAGLRPGGPAAPGRPGSPCSRPKTAGVQQCVCRTCRSAPPASKRTATGCRLGRQMSDLGRELGAGACEPGRTVGQPAARRDSRRLARAMTRNRREHAPPSRPWHGHSLQPMLPRSGGSQANVAVYRTTAVTSLSDLSL